MTKRSLCIWSILMLLTIFAQAGNASEEREGVVLRWNKVMLEAVRQANMGPPIVARALAITHTCMYDAWAAYDSSASGTEFGEKLRRPLHEHSDKSKDRAISYAAYRALSELFPGQVSLYDDLMAELGFDPTDSSESHDTPEGLGNLACTAVLEARRSDGSNQLGENLSDAYSDYTGYTPVNFSHVINDPNRWQPLTFVNAVGIETTQTFLCPHWGRVTPFAIDDPERFPLKKPALFGSRRYEQQALEILRLTSDLNDHQKVSAEYWADGPNSETPPGHWNLFAQFVAERDRMTTDQEVKLFFALNNALFDASIWAWWTKREYDYVRPITAIRYLFEDEEITSWAGPFQGVQTIKGSEWHPYQPTTFPSPPFSEYVSGHSTFSAAAAEVLRRFTGRDDFGYSATVDAGRSIVEPGLVPKQAVTMTWPTFTDAADDAGLSRRYGGIHFRDGDLQGRRIGKKIGFIVWKKASRLFGG